MAARSAGRLKNVTINRPKSLAALVADRLREAIFRAEIGLGEVLSEEKIASAMNVSRTPVREALTMLQLQGLITIFPQRGSVVYQPEADDLQELVDFRLMLETQAAPLALKNDPVRAEAKLSKAIVLMENARRDEDVLAYAHADTLFHRTFFEHCKNHYLKDAYEIVSGRVAALRAHLSRPIQVHRSKSHSEHLRIAEAFANNDGDRLVAELSTHISVMSANYIRALNILRGEAV